MSGLAIAFIVFAVIVCAATITTCFMLVARGRQRAGNLVSTVGTMLILISGLILVVILG